MNNRLVLILISVIISLFLLDQYWLNNNINSTETQGEAAIGGGFSLVDQNGKIFTDANLNGKISLIYFGFTHCPDVCPLTLSNLSLAMNELGNEAKNFRIIFVTTDPKRDTSKHLKEFLSNFTVPIIGLTGSEEQIKKAMEVYKVYAKRLNESKNHKGKNYNIEHTTIIYIMDKSGKFIDHLNSESKVDEIVAKLKTL